MLTNEMKQKQAELIAKDKARIEGLEEKYRLKGEAEIVKSIKDYKRFEKKLDMIKEQMDQVKKFFLEKFIETGTRYYEDKNIKATYVPEAEVVTLDSKGIKENHPEIAEEFSKVSSRKAYVLITKKDKEKKQKQQIRRIER